MTHVATERAFYRGRIIEAGQSFEPHEGFKGKWAVPQDDYTPEKDDEEAKVAKAKEALQGKKASKKDDESKDDSAKK